MLIGRLNKGVSKQRGLLIKDSRPSFMTWHITSTFVNPADLIGIFCTQTDALTLYSLVVALRTTRFNTHKFYAVPTQCMNVFGMDFRKTAIIFLSSFSLAYRFL